MKITKKKYLILSIILFLFWLGFQPKNLDFNINIDNDYKENTNPNSSSTSTWSNQGSTFLNNYDVNWDGAAPDNYYIQPDGASIREIFLTKNDGKLFYIIASDQADIYISFYHYDNIHTDCSDASNDYFQITDISLDYEFTQATSGGVGATQIGWFDFRLYTNTGNYQTIRLYDDLPDDPILIHDGSVNFGNLIDEVTNGEYIQKIEVRYHQQDVGLLDFDSLNFNYFKINYEYTYGNLPTPPQNLEVPPAVNHLQLNWDAPSSDGGLSISQYHIYRSTSAMGTKTEIGTTSNTYYIDTNIDDGEQYFYWVTAENAAGESGYSNYDYATAAISDISWNVPTQNERVLFGAGETIFNFSYNYQYLDEVRLILNGVDYGDVYGKTSQTLDYSSSIDGNVNAELTGYYQNTPVCSDTRNFVFGKLNKSEDMIHHSGSQVLGKELYMLIHDPSGDQSYSSLSDQSELSIGVGGTTSNGLDTEYVEELQQIGTGASTRIQGNSLISGYDYNLKVDDINFLKSSQDQNDIGEIGPGNGDLYWGETWEITWEIHSTNVTYFNGTVKDYDLARVSYGLNRTNEILVYDSDAPQEWKNINPVHSNYQGVLWNGDGLGALDYQGGTFYEEKSELNATKSQFHNLSISISSDTKTILGLASNIFEFNLSRKILSEEEANHESQSCYNIFDGETGDSFDTKIGIDPIFGTYVFYTNSSTSGSSYPIEEYTSDYMKPRFRDLTINLDTDKDGIEPSKLDTPQISVEVTDETGISTVKLLYSVDGGEYETILMQEDSENADVYTATLPRQDEGVKVDWYITARDNSGLTGKKYDGGYVPFSYNVKSLDDGEKTGDNFDSPLILVVAIGGVAIIGILAFVAYQRHKNAYSW